MIEPISFSWLAVKAAHVIGGGLGKAVAAKTVADGASVTLAHHLAVGGTVTHAIGAGTLGVTHPLTLTMSEPMGKIVLDTGAAFAAKALAAETDAWQRLLRRVDMFLE
jgi:hypothetical protein